LRLEEVGKHFEVGDCKLLRRFATNILQGDHMLFADKIAQKGPFQIVQSKFLGFIFPR
jgi:hypothetical protein